MAKLNWQKHRKPGKKYLSDAIWQAKLKDKGRPCPHCNYRIYDPDAVYCPSCGRNSKSSARGQQAAKTTLSKAEAIDSLKKLIRRAEHKPV